MAAVARPEEKAYPTKRRSDNSSLKALKVLPRPPPRLRSCGRVSPRKKKTVASNNTPKTVRTTKTPRQEVKVQELAAGHRGQNRGDTAYHGGQGEKAGHFVAGVKVAHDSPRNDNPGGPGPTPESV